MGKQLKDYLRAGDRSRLTELTQEYRILKSRLDAIKNEVIHRGHGVASVGSKGKDPSRSGRVFDEREILRQIDSLNEEFRRGTRQLRLLKQIAKSERNRQMRQ